MMRPHGVHISAAEQMDGGRRVEEVDTGAQPRCQAGVEDSPADPRPRGVGFDAGGVVRELPERVDDEQVRVRVTHQGGRRPGVVAVQDHRRVGTDAREVAQPGARDEFVAVVGVSGRCDQVDDLTGAQGASDVGLTGPASCRCPHAARQPAKSRHLPPFPHGERLRRRGGGATRRFARSDPGHANVARR